MRSHPMTAERKTMWRRIRIELLAAGFACAGWVAAEDRISAPSMAAPAVNQLTVAGNACGPAALLNAFRSGNKDWMRAFDAVEGSTDRERILSVIRKPGMRPSSHSKGVARWSKRGVSVADLRDIANELTTGLYLPMLSEDVFFRQTRETPERLLARIHQRLGKSLEKGLPPVLSLRRYVLRPAKDGTPGWVVLDAHFVTITSLPRKLPRGAVSFPVSYIDPWGGRRLDGVLAIPEVPVFPDETGHSSCIEARFPKSAVGASQVRKHEKSALIASAGIGRW